MLVLYIMASVNISFSIIYSHCLLKVLCQGKCSWRCLLLQRESATEVLAIYHYSWSQSSQQQNCNCILWSHATIMRYESEQQKTYLKLMGSSVKYFMCHLEQQAWYHMRKVSEKEKSSMKSPRNSLLDLCLPSIPRLHIHMNGSFITSEWAHSFIAGSVLLMPSKCMPTVCSNLPPHYLECGL